MRDLLLGRSPIFWFVDQGLSIATFAIAVLTFFLLDRISDRLLLIPDALGLGFFSVLGATYAMQMNLSVLIISLMGVVTGVFGGILRDVICNNIPSVFKRSTELYATCAFIGTWGFIILVKLHVDISASIKRSRGDACVAPTFEIRPYFISFMESQLLLLLC